MEKKTPVYERHVALGGKIVPFAGYLLPVQYGSGLIAEHMAVRTAAGIFDVSHMGELFINGRDALENVNHMLTNDFTQMEVGRVRYSPMCNEHGGVVDDLLVQKYAEDSYMLVVNGANVAKDDAWIRSRVSGDAEFLNLSEDYAEFALQGPRSREILLKLVKEADIPGKYYTFKSGVSAGGFVCDLSQTGYTGELGYEILCKPEDATGLWDMLLEAGKEFGLIPCGLGARDTLRLEAGMPLYGHEMDDDTSPIEAGLGFAVKLDKAEFVGKPFLTTSPKRQRVGLKVTGRGIIRENCALYRNGIAIGRSTSGTHLPYIGYPAASALVDAGTVRQGDRVEADVRGRMVEAEVVDYVFYKRK